MSATFVDDSRLVLLLDEFGHLQPPGLVFLDTNQTTIDGGELAKTFFRLDPYQHVRLEPSFVSDLGGHGPSCEDDRFAPFYPDPSHRLLVIEFMGIGCLFVMKTEALLRLAREREGEELHWGEWKAHVTRISTDVDTRKLWVSGPRLCFVYLADSGETLVDVYDFSAQTSARHTEAGDDGVVERVAPSMTHTLHFRVEETLSPYGCHDSIAFFMVKASRSLDRPDRKLIEVLCVRIIQTRQWYTCGTLYD